MTVQQVIDLAIAGELKQLHIANETADVIGFINLGLIELYTRFALKSNEAIITLKEGKTIYTLDGTDVDVDMTTNDLLQIISAYGDNAAGETDELPLNDSQNPYSINTISYNQIQVPVVTEGALLSIIYVSKPTFFTIDDLASDIELPDQLVEPLLHYIGYRGHGSVDGNINTENNTHYMRFDASCNKIKNLGMGMVADDMTMETRLSDRGFV